MNALFSLRLSLPASMAVVLIALLGLFNLDAYRTAIARFRDHRTSR